VALRAIEQVFYSIERDRALTSSIGTGCVGYRGTACTWSMAHTAGARPA
jgi:hypothetical protein